MIYVSSNNFDLKVHFYVLVIYWLLYLASKLNFVCEMNEFVEPIKTMLQEALHLKKNKAYHFSGSEDIY